MGLGLGIARRYLADWSAKMKTFLAGDDGVLGSADDRRYPLVGGSNVPRRPCQHGASSCAAHGVLGTGVAMLRDHRRLP